MAIKQIIDDSKSRLDALLTYANGVTGVADVSIGDAVKTLCDGFGQGGGTEKIDGTYSITNFNAQKAIPFGTEWTDYLAIWEYTAAEQWIATGENKNLTIGGVCIHLGTSGYDCTITHQINPSAMTQGSYAVHKAPGMTNPNIYASDDKFQYGTLYQLPTGYASIPDNIRFTVYRVYV